jgi:2-oxoglutarate dehydrogenase E2 component (dihydrolipoamide succinyltransferase)
MNVLGSGSASSRRTIVAGLLAAVFGAAVTAQAQQAPAPAPAAPAQAEPAPAPDAFKFTSDAALVVWVVKGDKTADFESAWSEVLGKLAASGKPDLKTVVDSVKIFKADGPATADGVTYFFVIDPVVKTSTYNPSTLIYSSGIYERAQADEIFNKINGAINPQGGIRPIPIVRVGASAAAPMAPAAPAPAPAAPAAPPAQ